MKRLTLFVTLLGLVVSPLVAQEEDAEGCKDSTLLTRMTGCHISSCEKKDFDAAEIATAIVEGEEKFSTVEGSVETIDYNCAENVSLLAIVRNAQNALKQAGFALVYSRSGSTYPALTMRKGGVWVAIDTAGASYTQRVVRQKEMEQQMLANAETMEADIAKNGVASVYGIHFDTGKASILPDSEQTLSEVARLLAKNSSWKMQIEGHTDNVGGKEANVKLSQARAEAVRVWLGSHGVESARLVAKGFGDSKPMADNSTDAGRAKNRRVDLRKL